MVPDNLHDFFVARASVAGALIGLLFVAMTVASERLARAGDGGLIRLRQVRWRTLRDALFLAGLLITFTAQLAQGIQVIGSPGDSGAVNTISVLVAICFLTGIDRSWELAGGPLTGFRQEVTALVRGREYGVDDPGGEEPAS